MKSSPDCNAQRQPLCVNYTAVFTILYVRGHRDGYMGAGQLITSMQTFFWAATTAMIYHVASHYAQCCRKRETLSMINARTHQYSCGVQCRSCSRVNHYVRSSAFRLWCGKRALISLTTELRLVLLLLLLPVYYYCYYYYFRFKILSCSASTFGRTSVAKCGRRRADVVTNFRPDYTHLYIGTLVNTWYT